MNTLLVVFKRPAQSPGVRQFMTGFKGIEIPPNAWLIPSAAPPAVFTLNLNKILAPDEGFFVVRVFRPDSPMCIVNFPYLPDWLQPG